MIPRLPFHVVFVPKIVPWSLLLFPRIIFSMIINFFIGTITARDLSLSESLIIENVKLQHR